jgi:predicted transcriptional regulator
LRGICSDLGLSVGVVQYHLQFLTRAHSLCSRRYSRYKRYFESGRFSEAEMKTISLLRHGTVRRILSMLFEEKTLSHRDLASGLGISSQALTWQINRLSRAGLVDSTAEGIRKRYHLAEDCATMIRTYLGQFS